MAVQESASPITAVPTSLRDRKKLATRRTLRQAALRLVADRGLDRVTVEDIAEEAGVSTRTFFNYFPTKEAVLFGADPARFESLRTRVLDRPAKEDALTALRRTLVEESRSISEELSALGGDPADWLSRMRAAHGDAHLRAAHAAHMASVERILAEAVATRLGTDLEEDPYPMLLCGAAVGAMRAVFSIWANGGGRVALEELAEAAFQTLADGFPERCTIRRIAGLTGSRAGRASGMFRRSRH